MLFKNKIVIVTGATSHIGVATCIKFAKEGASVVLVGRNEEKLANLKKKIDEESLPAYVINADLTDDDEVQNVIEETVKKFDKIDVLVNNAIVLRQGSIKDGSILETYDDVMNINVRALMNLTSLAAAHLIKSKGNIVNVSTIGGSRVVTPRYGVSCVSHAAINHFTKAAAIELGKEGVRVNCVSTGVATDTVWHNTLLEGWPNDEEVADLITYLASDDARSVTGSNMVCDAGALATQKTVYT